MPGPAHVLTIGHSTHASDRFAALLRAHRIELLGDVRRYPGSRRHPQFGAETLQASLNHAGIAYQALGEQLGGRRRPRCDSPLISDALLGGAGAWFTFNPTAVPRSTS